MKIDRLLTNIISSDLEQSKSFFMALFAFTVDFDSDWFVHLVSENGNLELGLLLEEHEIVPDRVRGKKSGIYITFVVEDAVSVFRKAQELGYEVLQAPEDTFYGQKRVLIVSPDGTICDVSAPIKM